MFFYKKKNRYQAPETQGNSSVQGYWRFSACMVLFCVYVDEESCSFLAVPSPERTRIMKKEAVAQKNVRQFTEEEWKAMGTRIREAREEAGMKQIDLATLLAIGKNQMYRIENGQAPCKTEYLFEISQIFGVSLDYLYFGENVCSEVGEIVEKCRGKGLKEIRKAADILRAFFS